MGLKRKTPKVGMPTGNKNTNPKVGIFIKKNAMSTE